jgi:hypothetical protein
MVMSGVASIFHSMRIKMQFFDRMAGFAGLKALKFLFLTGNKNF